MHHYEKPYKFGAETINIQKKISKKVKKQAETILQSIESSFIISTVVCLGMK